MKRIWIALLCGWLCGCGTNPVTGEQELQLISERQEIQIGEQEYGYLQQAEGGQLTVDPRLQQYVSDVGNRLALASDRPYLPYEFVVLNNSIPNAWALPGGKIAINRGLLVELNSEAELAAVLSHEIVHSAARHGAQRIEQGMLMGAGVLGLQELMKDHKYEDVVVGSAATAAGLIALKYSRQAELEADYYGIKYLSAAGYDPQAAVTLQETFLRLEQDKNSPWLGGLLATHPPSQERLEANRRSAAQYPPGRVGAKEYAKAIAELKSTELAYRDLDDGYLALQQGQLKRALELAHSGMLIAPQEAHLYNLKGKVLRLQGDFTGAIDAFDQAIKRNPDYFDFYLQRGLIKQKLGDYVAARRDLLKSEQLLPSADGEYALGMLALHSGDRQRAIIHFKRAAQNPSATGRAAREQLRRLSG